MLLDHVSVGVSNIETARKFYDPVFDSLGCKCLGAGDGYAVYGYEQVEFLLLPPFDGGPCTHGNGTHIGFVAPSREAVDAFYQAALANGGTDEGAPGVREAYPFPDAYSAYVRDPDKNKLEIIHNGFSKH